MTDDAPRRRRENAIPLDDILMLVHSILGSLAPDRLVTWLGVSRRNAERWLSDEAPSCPASSATLDDAQWAVIEPFFPSLTGVERRPERSLRLVFEAILYVLKTGCHCRCLPAEFPPRFTVNR